MNQRPFVLFRTERDNNYFLSFLFSFSSFAFAFMFRIYSPFPPATFPLLSTRDLYNGRTPWLRTAQVFQLGGGTGHRHFGSTTGPFDLQPQEKVPRQVQQAHEPQRPRTRRHPTASPPKSASPLCRSIKVHPTSIWRSRSPT